VTIDAILPFSQEGKSSNIHVKLSVPSYSGISIKWKVVDKENNEITGITIDNP
jgi:hypothetical protein